MHHFLVEALNAILEFFTFFLSLVAVVHNAWERRVSTPSHTCDEIVSERSAAHHACRHACLDTGLLLGLAMLAHARAQGVGRWPLLPSIFQIPHPVGKPNLNSEL